MIMLMSINLSKFKQKVLNLLYYIYIRSHSSYTSALDRGLIKGCYSSLLSCYEPCKFLYHKVWPSITAKKYAIIIVLFHEKLQNMVLKQLYNLQSCRCTFNNVNYVQLEGIFIIKCFHRVSQRKCVQPILIDSTQFVF